MKAQTFLQQIVCNFLFFLMYMTALLHLAFSVLSCFVYYITICFIISPSGVGSGRRPHLSGRGKYCRCSFDFRLDIHRFGLSYVHTILS